MTYGELMGSMVHLVRGTPILRRRAFIQGCLFFAFSLFWTTTPLLLAGPHYGLTQNGIALFALAGVSGAIAAPIAGRIADRGWGRPATGAAIALVALAMLGSIFVPRLISECRPISSSAIAPYLRSPQKRAEGSTASTCRRRSWAARSARRSGHGLTREGGGAVSG
jgi:hypothetical protein